MIFVLFFSLSGAKVQFIVIVHNLTPNKTKKICFTTQNLFSAALVVFDEFLQDATINKAKSKDQKK